nr:nuclear transport factor 2 family protein [Acuticoccus kalidii]
MEAIEEIKRLKAYYAKCADEKYTEDHERRPQDEVNAVARDQCSVFTEDAIWDGGVFGRHEGREAIYNNLRLGPWKFTVHMFMTPLIEVDGDRGTGRWLIWETGTLTEGDTPIFLAASIEEEYVKQDGKWLISKVEQTNRFMTRFDTPWTVNKNQPYRP